MSSGVQIFEAIVTDSAPDPDLPGFIKVKIPELFGADELPCLVGPIHPGWTAGGWQSVPGTTLPDGTTDETEVRVLVVKLSMYVYRYMGTTQGWDVIDAAAGTMCGARSHDGHHTLLMDGDGIHLSGFDRTHSVDILTDGVVVTSDSVKLGSPSAIDFVALSSLVDAAFLALRTELLSHTHTCATGPGGPPVGIGATSDATGATKVMAE